MYLKYGTYQHGWQEASVVITRADKFTDAMVKLSTVEQWSISGRLVADSLSQLTAAIQALEAAYSVNGRDLVLLDPNGNPTAHKLLSSTTDGGTRVTRFTYPVGNGAEYTTYRSYEIQVEGEVPASGTLYGQPGGINPMVTFSETISFRGTGGPRRVVRELRNGLPQVQIVSQRTPVYATQSGTAVGFAGFPAIPQPIWPAFENEPERQISKKGPEVTGSGNDLMQRKFEISWSYSFQAPGRFNGQPGVGYF